MKTKKTDISKMNTIFDADLSVKESCLSEFISKFKQLKINGNFVEFKNIEMSDIITTKNNVRFSGTDADKVDQFKMTISNNQYRPYHKGPPPVAEPMENGKYMLISGHHRYDAHLDLGHKTFLCIVYNFDTELDRCVWRSHENVESNTPFIKNFTTYDDQIKDVVARIQQGVINGNRTSIEEYLIRTQMVSAKATKKLSLYTNEILMKIGKINPEHVQSWSKEKKKHLVSRLNKDISDHTFINVTFKEEKNDNDYDWRFFKQVVEKLEKNPNAHVTGVCSANAASSEKVVKIRTYKSNNLMKNMYKFCLKVVKMVESGVDFRDPNKVNLEFVPQLASEVQPYPEDHGKNNFINQMTEKYGSKIDNNILVTIKNFNVDQKKELKRILSEV